MSQNCATNIFKMHSPDPRYRLDTFGHLVLVGLTFEETTEFEKLDASLPYGGKHAWPDEGLSLLPMEARW